MTVAPRPASARYRKFYAAVLGYSYQPVATVPGGPLDTPYGRMAVITDPQGATFAIMGTVSSD